MVFVISAIHDHKCNDGDDTISKLKIIIKCNKLLGRVNKCNQYLTYYQFGRKTIQQWKKIFRNFEISVVNAMVVYYYKNPEFQRIVTRSFTKFLHMNCCNYCQISEQNEMMFCQDLVEILSTTKYSKRSHCTLYGYKRNHNGKYKDTKTYDFCKKCNKYVCKDHFKCFILRAISSAVVFLFVCLFENVLISDIFL